jgi:hypothetical protein
MKNNRSSSLENREQGYTTMHRGLGRLTAMAVGDLRNWSSFPTPAMLTFTTGWNLSRLTSSRPFSRSI